MHDAMEQIELPHEWTVHPIRNHPIKGLWTSLLVLVCGLLVALAVGQGEAGPLAGGGAILFQLLILNRFYLPSRYRIDVHGMAVRYPIGARSMRWSEIARFRHDARGGYASPRPRGGAFDSRGISLLFNDQGPAIVAVITAHLQTSQSHEDTSASS